MKCPCCGGRGTVKSGDGGAWGRALRVANTIADELQRAKTANLRREGRRLKEALRDLPEFQRASASTEEARMQR